MLRGRPALVPLVGILLLLAGALGGEDPPAGPPPPAPVTPAPPAAPPTGEAPPPVTGDPEPAPPPTPPPTTSAPAPTEPAPPPTAVSPGDDADPVAAALAGLTLEEQVGQLLVVEVFGDDATAPSASAQAHNLARFGVATPAEVVSHHHVGGVTYFGHPTVEGAGVSNVADPLAVAELSAGLQAAAAADSGVGLLLGIDQEGGPVVRLRDPVTVFPAAQTIGDIGDPDLARRVAEVVGTELRALGITVDFAPVADVDSNPANPVIGVRAFSAEPDVASAMVAAAVQGFAAVDVAATIKHFPGHGDTTVDSHLELPTVTADLARLRDVELPPFVAGIAAGAPLVMVGHLAVPALDPSGVPATLSAPIVTDLLRGQLGFDGVVVTDGLQMGALDGFGDDGEVAVRALEAGVDLLLLPGDPAAVSQAILAAVDEGRLTPERIAASVERILALKASLGVLDPPAVDVAAAAEVLAAPAHDDVLAEVTARAGG